MFDTNTLLASLVWGMVGAGCIVYGKKQGAAIPLTVGFALLAVSYFIPSPLWMSLVSAALLSAMYGLIRRGY